MLLSRSSKPTRDDGNVLHRIVMSAAAAAVLITAGCGTSTPSASVQSLPDPRPYSDRHDYHSYGNPEQIRVKHAALDLDVSFADRKLKGTATLSVEPGSSG